MPTVGRRKAAFDNRCTVSAKLLTHNSLVTVLDILYLKLIKGQSESPGLSNGIEASQFKGLEDIFTFPVFDKKNRLVSVQINTITATKAGMHWDLVLSEYCSGNRGLLQGEMAFPKHIL